MGNPKYLQVHQIFTEIIAYLPTFWPFLAIQNVKILLVCAKNFQLPHCDTKSYVVSVDENKQFAVDLLGRQVYLLSIDTSRRKNHQNCFWCFPELLILSYYSFIWLRRNLDVLAIFSTCQKDPLGQNLAESSTICPYQVQRWHGTRVTSDLEPIIGPVMPYHISAAARHTYVTITSKGRPDGAEALPYGRNTELLRRKTIHSDFVRSFVDVSGSNPGYAGFQARQPSTYSKMILGEQAHAGLIPRPPDPSMIFSQA